MGNGFHGKERNGGSGGPRKKEQQERERERVRLAGGCVLPSV